jgi:hypothetical protein
MTWDIFFENCHGGKYGSNQLAATGITTDRQSETKTIVLF